MRNNHGPGITFNSNWIVRNNYIHKNGQLGIGGSGENILVEANEISENNQAGFDTGWEAGGSKFAYTTNLTVRNNYVHDNLGPGLWTDIDNINTIYEENIVTYNNNAGIKHEISFDVIIRNNFLHLMVILITTGFGGLR